MLAPPGVASHVGAPAPIVVFDESANDNSHWCPSSRKLSEKVTLRRPEGGLGGNPWDSYISDAYDPTTPRQTAVHWDLKFVAWLEANGYKVEYCTDLDIHSDPAFLTSYRLMLSVGHDEYWSPEMRAHIESFIAEGGNVAFFSGNTCWWRVHVTDSGTAFSCDKSVPVGGAVPFDQWFATDPENRVTGVSYRNAGGWWDGPREALGSEGVPRLHVQSFHSRRRRPG